MTIRKSHQVVSECSLHRSQVKYYFLLIDCLTSLHIVLAENYYVSIALNFTSLCFINQDLGCRSSGSCIQKK